MNIEKLYEQINSESRRKFPAAPVHELIAQQAARTPDAVAVLSGESTQSYAQLANRTIHDTEPTGNVILTGFFR